jgi:cell division transport system permease protein
MQLRHVYSELGQSLRRNLSMHIAVILTLFVSLTLVGLGVILNQQADKAARQWGSELQITVFLCRDGGDSPGCNGEVTDAQKTALIDEIKQNPEVASYRVESKAEAFEKVKELFGPERFEGANPAATVDDMAESVWITLKDPDEYAGITSAVIGLDGVDNIRDQRETVGPILRAMDAMQTGALVTAAFLVVAAMLLVANTIRLAAFARRKEISIMRLVGASTLYIALPFLLEAIVTALIGVALGTAALASAMYFGVQQQLQEMVGFIPWVGWEDFARAVVVIAIVGPVLTLIPTLALTRKYIKV